MSDKLSEDDKVTEVDTIISTIAKSIDTIYYGEDSFNVKEVPYEEVKEFIEGLNSQQFQKIVDILINGPYISYDIKYKCKSCKEVNEHELKGLVDFFI